MSARLGTTSITRFNSRNSGRDLSVVRRPVKTEKPKAKKSSKPERNDGEVKVSDG